MEIELKNPVHTGFYEGSVLYPGEGGGGFEYGEFEYVDQEMEGYLSRHDFTIEYDYAEYTRLVSVAVNDYFLERINDKIYDLFEIEELFKNKHNDVLTSPKYYNFETDKSYFMVDVNERDYKKFLSRVFKEYYDDLSTWIKDRHTSYDGFISFYSNDIEDWKEDFLDDKIDYIQLETIFLMLLDDGKDDICELYDLASDIFYQIELWFEDYHGNKFYHDGRLLKRYP